MREVQSRVKWEAGLKDHISALAQVWGREKTTIGLSIGERTDQILQQKFREQILCSTRTSGDVCTLQHVNIVVLHVCFSVCVVPTCARWSIGGLDIINWGVRALCVFRELP